MPTPAELRHALGRLEAEAPHPARVRAAVLYRVGSASTSGRRRTYRTGPLIVAAVAVMIALATVLVLSLRAGDTGQPVATPTPLGTPPPATELTWSFDLPNPPVGTTLRRLSITADSQRSWLQRSDLGSAMMITMHEPGRFEPGTDLKSPRRVSVGGSIGYFGPERGQLPGSLVWPTNEGGWMQLSGFGVVTGDTSEKAADPAQVLAEQLIVASLVQFGSFGSPPLPFRLGWLPSGISVQGVASDVQGDLIDETFGTVTFSAAGPVTDWVGTVLVTRVDAPGRSYTEEIEDVVGPDRTTLTVGGRPAVAGPAVESGREPTADGQQPLRDARVLAVDVGDGSALLVFVVNPAADRYPDDVLRRIAEEADVSMSMADPSTWVPAPEAVRG